VLDLVDTSLQLYYDIYYIEIYTNLTSNDMQ